MEATVNLGSVRVKILVGELEQPIYRRSDGKLFITGPRGFQFTIHMCNTSFHRIEVLVSVDGCNTFVNERADMFRNNGYVLAPGETREVTGWALGFNGTVPFVFHEQGNPVGHHASVSVSENIGVIGFAVYHDKWYYDPSGLTGLYTNAHQVERPFSRSGIYPSEFMCVYYCSTQGLLDNSSMPDTKPEPFPGSFNLKNLNLDSKM